MSKTLETSRFFSIPQDSFNWYSKNRGDISDLRCEYFDYAGVSLIQSYKLNYYIVVTLVEKSHERYYSDFEKDLASGNLPFDEAFPGMKRKLFIQLTKTEEVLHSLDKVFTTLGLEKIPTNKIKKELAQRGGTIPNTRYFD